MKKQVFSMADLDPEPVTEIEEGAQGRGDAGVRYARIVFEEEIPADAAPEEAARILQNAIVSLIADHGVRPDDIEIHDEPYVREE